MYLSSANKQEKSSLMNESDLPLQSLLKNKLSKKVTFGVSRIACHSFEVHSIVFDSAITRHCTRKPNLITALESF